LDISTGFQTGSNGPPDGGKQIDCRKVDSLTGRHEAAHASGLPGEQRQEPILAGASDAQAMQPYASRARVRKNLLCAGHLAVGEDQDVAALALEKFGSFEKACGQFGPTYFTPPTSTRQRP
jgi:hypothetical protein